MHASFKRSQVITSETDAENLPQIMKVYFSPKTCPWVYQNSHSVAQDEGMNAHNFTYSAAL